MRPIELEFQAFGSYGGAQRLDLQRLAGHGIFAITGPTGAGKSTIFDALVYALYGKLPGFRTEGTIRSHFASEEVLTTVRLRFGVAGAIYEVERSPEQLRPKRRGAGFTRQPATVVLRREGVEGATQGTEAEAQILQLVGLTKDQFERVVLLPQGRFEAVLKADTRERSELLRTLFPVERYRRFTLAARREADERRSALDEARQRGAERLQRLHEALDALEAQLGLPEPEAPATVAERLGIAQTAVETLGRHRVELERRATEAQRAVEAAEFQAAQVEALRRDRAAAEGFEAEELLEVERRHALDAAQALEQARPNLEANRRAREAATGSANDLAQALGTARSAGLELGDPVDPEAIRALAAATQRLATQADQASQRHAALLERQALVDAATAAHADAAESLEAAQAAAAAMAAELAPMEEQRRQLEPLARGALADQRELELAQLALEAARRGAELTEAVTQFTEQATDAEAQVALAERTMEELRQAAARQLASSVAGTLVEGLPCPVCGSIEHPSPAQAVGDVTSQLAAAGERLEAARAAARAARGAADRALGNLEALSGVPDLGVAAERAEQAQRTAEASQRAHQELEELIERLEQRREAAVAAAAAVEAHALKAATSSAALGQDRKYLDDERERFSAEFGPPETFSSQAAARWREVELLTNLAEAAERAARDAELLAVTEGLLVGLLERFAVEQVSQLEGQLWDPAELAAELAALEAAAEHRRIVRARLRAAAEAGVGDVDPPLDDLRAVALDRRGEADLVAGHHAAQRAALDQVARDLEALEAFDLDLPRLQARFEVAQEVAERCAGRGAGSRITLEDWVLGEHLRAVLGHANLRLATMSGGRYELCQDLEGEDRRHRQGLDLAVRDAYTGSVRSARTLSGGESFEAALALALGLADVVAAGSTAVLGALFVDEGFGSLDPEALDRVLEVLGRLQDGRRVVGVISHVPELKAAIASGVVVEATARGSSFTVRYPAAP